MSLRSSLVAQLAVWLVLVACDGGDAGGSPTPTPTAPPASAPASPVAPSPGPSPSGEALPQLALGPVADGFERPTFVTNANDGTGRLFVLNKPGVINVIEDGAVRPAPFLDLTGVVRDQGNEQGLLGLAFHPEFARNGRFFVAYTATDAKNTIAEYRSEPGAATAAASSGRVLLAVADQYPNHNGGMLAFGPDGYLYISMGDGGGGGDPLGSGQDLDTLLGKVLRIDVDSEASAGYVPPPSNPFIDTPGARPEIWAYGLRNPWRMSFDRATGDLWIADVGQNAYEEVNVQPADSPGGENYGWSIMEGDHCFAPASDCAREGLALPVFEYSHDDGCSVTGGYVYRGASLPALVGAYVFADYCSGNVWATRPGAGGYQTTRVGSFSGSVTSFGEDEAGELYVTFDNGGVYRVILG